MNIKASYKYQLSDQIRSITIFYFVIFCIYTLFTILTAFMSARGVDMGNSFSGIESATMIFLFVVGLNSFKENFGMMLQNGISRKTLFTGRIVTMLTVCLAMTLIDRIVYFIFIWISSIFVKPFSELLIEQIYIRENIGMVRLQLESLLFNFSLNIMCLSIGYALSTLFYKLNKLGKVIIGAGVPVLLMIIMPIVDSVVFNGAINRAIGTFLGKILGFVSNMPIYAIISFTVFTAICCGVSWLMTRRTALRT